MISGRCFPGTKRMSIRGVSSKSGNHRIFRSKPRFPLPARSSISATTAFVFPENLCKFQQTQLRFWSANHEHLSVEESQRHGFYNSVIFDDGNEVEKASAEAPVAVGSTVDDTIQGSEDRRYAIIRSLSEEMQNNVFQILQELDRSHFDAHKDDESPEESSQRMTSRENRSLMKRWKAAYRREKENIQRAHGSEFEKPIRKMTIDELWEQTLQATSLDALLEKRASQESQVSPGERERDDFNKTDNAVAFSPIFGLAVDEYGEGYIPDLDWDDENLQPVAGLADDGGLLPLEPRSSAASQSMVDGIAQAVALLATLRNDDWVLLTSISVENTNQVSDDDYKVQNATETLRDYGRELLDHAKESGFVLTSDECNLLLANFLVSSKRREEDILEQGLLMFDEMIKMKGLGIVDTGPNSTSYRLLFLALSRRLSAVGEAARICKSALTPSIALTSETLYEAMRICQAYGDLGTAAKLLDKALDPVDMTRLSMGTCGIFLDMLKSRNMMSEAIDFYKRIHEAKAFRLDSEDTILLQLCRWPNKARNGDAIDCTPVLVCCMESVLERLEVHPRPHLQLVFTLIERLSHTARLDPSMENKVKDIILKVLTVYPNFWPGTKLLTTGLRCAEATDDAKVMAELFAREVQRSGDNRQLEEGTMESHKQSSTIPQMLFRRSLNLALRNKDTESASSILACFEQIEDIYTLGAKSEIHGLAILCFARAGRSQDAKNHLLKLITQGLKVSDELFGAVLHSLFIDDKTDEAFAIFRRMECSEEESFPIPLAASYNAVLASHIREQKWESAISIEDQMKASGVTFNSRTVHGLMLAYLGRGGTKSVAPFLRDLLSTEPPIDQRTFLLAVRVVLPKVGTSSIDEFRATIRKMGEEDPSLRNASLKLIRSARVAEMEERKLGRQNPPNVGVRARSEADGFWRTALTELLDFADEVRELNAPSEI